MFWGLHRRAGPYLDVASAVLGLTLCPVGSSSVTRYKVRRLATSERETLPKSFKHEYFPAYAEHFPDVPWAGPPCPQGDRAASRSPQGRPRAWGAQHETRARRRGRRHAWRCLRGSIDRHGTCRVDLGV